MDFRDESWDTDTVRKAVADAGLTFDDIDGLSFEAEAGAVTAVVLAIGLAIYWYFRFGTMDESLLVEAGLIAVLGLVGSYLGIYFYLRVIQAQRAYEVNSKVITTSDAMLGRLVQM